MSDLDRFPAPPASPADDAAPSGSRRARSGLWIAVAAAALWPLTLAGLALFTANPVTLNVEQIRRADYVVTGRLSGDDGDVIVVERAWKGEGLPDSFRVENLSRTIIKAGRSYLIPLSRLRAGSLEVTATDLPDNPPLVYPVTDAAAAQLTAILSETVRKPGLRTTSWVAWMQ